MVCRRRRRPCRRPGLVAGGEVVVPGAGGGPPQVGAGGGRRHRRRSRRRRRRRRRCRPHDGDAQKANHWPVERSMVYEGGRRPHVGLQHLLPPVVLPVVHVGHVRAPGVYDRAHAPEGGNDPVVGEGEVGVRAARQERKRGGGLAGIGYAEVFEDLPRGALRRRLRSAVAAVVVLVGVGQHDDMTSPCELLLDLDGLGRCSCALKVLSVRKVGAHNDDALAHVGLDDALEGRGSPGAARRHAASVVEHLLGAHDVPPLAVVQDGRGVLVALRAELLPGSGGLVPGVLQHDQVGEVEVVDGEELVHRDLRMAFALSAGVVEKALPMRIPLEEMDVEGRWRSGWSGRGGDDGDIAWFKIKICSAISRGGPVSKSGLVRGLVLGGGHARKGRDQQRTTHGVA
mmetsp:Transcript_5457/g.14741  ORF Transcript_5457/g.14741 Transcript_5457/m.14741 type:complete len:399 (+) Transcript_5457:251-1447(+)